MEPVRGISAMPRNSIVGCACPYLESVLILATGCSSTPCSKLSRFKSHSSNFVSSEKSASTAPALVPVTSMGSPVPGDHAKAAVLGISLNRTIAPSKGVLAAELGCCVDLVRIEAKKDQLSVL